MLYDKRYVVRKIIEVARVTTQIPIQKTVENIFPQNYITL